MTEYRHVGKTFRLRSIIHKVRDELKAGWSEEIYHQALFEQIQSENIPVLYKPQKTLTHRGFEIHTFEADLIAWELIILELKALAFAKEFAGEHFAQMIHYLKCYGKDLGLLVNLGPSPIGFKRVVWDVPNAEIIENYEDIKVLLTAKDRDILILIRQSFLAISQQYGIGYPETVYRKLMATEARFKGLLVQEELTISARWKGMILGEHQTSLLLVQNRFLIHIRAMLDFPTQHDFARVKTYLTSLDIPYGIVINFGRKQIQIYTVTAT